jgi:hypothetical protein
MGTLFRSSAPPSPTGGLQRAWVISPSYKINDDMTSYFSYQHGEKAGISQLVQRRVVPGQAREDRTPSSWA